MWSFTALTNAWTLASGSSTSPGVVIGNGSFSVASLDLLVVASSHSGGGGHLNVGVVSGSITGGLVVSGCAENSSTVVNQSSICLQRNLSEPFLSACIFDVAQSGDESFAASAVAAASMHSQLLPRPPPIGVSLFPHRLHPL